MLRTKTDTGTAHTCRRCGNDYAASAHDIAKSDFACRDCRNTLQKEWRERRKAEGRPVKTGKVSREYHRAYEAEYFKRPENRERRNANMRAYSRNPDTREHHKARWLVRRAIIAGTLTRQPCEVCGTTPADAHHDDYSKPLQVRWLCRRHHIEFHAKAEGSAK